MANDSVPFAASSASSTSLGETKLLVASVSLGLGVSPLFADPTVLPSLVQESTPVLSLRAQDCILRAEPRAFNYWRAMGFEPLTARKNVAAFMLAEADEQHNAPVWARDWLTSMSSAYEVRLPRFTCSPAPADRKLLPQGLRLGQHQSARMPASTHSAGIEDGLLLVPPGRLAGHGTDFELKSICACRFRSC